MDGSTARWSKAHYLGIADGTPGSWSFLNQHTEWQLINFFDASEYVGKLARARYR